MIVLDASAVAEWLLGTTKSRQISARATAEDALLAPHLIDVEVLQTIRNLTAGGKIDAHRGREALLDLSDMRMTRYPHFPLFPRMWDLRHNFSAYDAAYIALAEALDVPLVTCDRKMKMASGHRAEIEVI